MFPKNQLASLYSRMIYEANGQVITRYRSGRQPEVNFVEGCL